MPAVAAATTSLAGLLQAGQTVSQQSGCTTAMLTVAPARQLTSASVLLFWTLGTEPEQQLGPSLGPEQHPLVANGQCSGCG
jgi:hypothetical protein